MFAVFLVLYFLAAACFLTFAFGGTFRQLNLLGLGVFFWSCVPLLQTLMKL